MPRRLHPIAGDLGDFVPLHHFKQRDDLLHNAVDPNRWIHDPSREDDPPVVREGSLEPVFPESSVVETHPGLVNRRGDFQGDALPRSQYDIEVVCFVGSAFQVARFWVAVEIRGHDLGRRDLIGSHLPAGHLKEWCRSTRTRESPGGATCHRR